MTFSFFGGMGMANVLLPVSEEDFPSPENVEKVFPIKKISPQGDDALRLRIDSYIGLLQFLTSVYNDHDLEGDKLRAFLINYCEVFGSILEGMIAAAVARKEEYCDIHCPYHEEMLKKGTYCAKRYLKDSRKNLYDLSSDTFEHLVNIISPYLDEEIALVVKDIRHKRNATHLSKEEEEEDKFRVEGLFKKSKKEIINDLILSLEKYLANEMKKCEYTPLLIE